MSDSLFIAEYLEQYFDELTPKEFYRNIFPAGELAAHKDKQEKGKYNAIAVELLPKEEDKVNARRYIITDELDTLDELLQKDNFIIVSPISYAGRSRKAENARYIYAMAIDLDGVATQQHLIDLFYQMENDIIPTPTYIVWSGGGLHLYYQFEKPIPCYKEQTKQLQKLKQGITKIIWNKYITILYDKPQFQSLFQGFRMCGNVTKTNKYRTRAFEVGKKIDIERLNDYVQEEYQVKNIKYKKDLTLQQAKELYPEWYKRRIEEKQPPIKSHWTTKEDLYNWWLKKIKVEATENHRYFAIMCLAIYAKKSGVSYERLEQDAFSLLERFDYLTTDEKNHFKREDILSALEAYNDNYYTFPIDTIKQLTQIDIKKNKRNGRKQAEHLARIRLLQQYDYPNGTWRGSGNRNGKGRTKDKIIKQWRQDNPAGTIKECIEQTQISKSTVYKYWKEVFEK